MDSEAERESGQPALETWKALLRFLPTFEAPGYSFGRFEGAKGQFAHPCLSPEALDFIDALHEQAWLTPFDWPSWQREAERLVSSRTAVATADLTTLRRLLTVHVRKDRFCDGHLFSMFESGHMTAILRRLGDLLGNQLHFEQRTVVDVPRDVLENAHWRPQAAKLGRPHKDALDAATAPAHKDKRTIEKLRLSWAREETWINHSLNALLASVPEVMLAKVLADLCGEPVASHPQTCKLHYANIRSVTGDPDFILRDESRCVLGESKVQAHSKSAKYSFAQFTKYMQLGVICACAEDASLRRVTSHVILSPSLDPAEFCSDFADWSPSVQGIRLVADAAALRGTTFKDWARGVREALLGKRVRTACALDEDRVEQILASDSPVLIPTYVITWERLTSAIEQACKSQGMASLALAAASLRSMAYGGTR